MNYTDRVARGAAELDRILPGWYEKIDLEILDLDSPCKCVLGQLSVDIIDVPGSYGGVVMALSHDATATGSKRWARSRGFLAQFDAKIEEDADRLTEAWKRFIRQSLEA